MLVLAGPGSGKTQVLTCRIARLLDAAREQNFRVLALTFTNKAADEMKSRVATFVPGLEERATIATFHSFCGQMLRQHGVHIGINPDFAIYSTDDDRRAVLKDALERGQREGVPVNADDVRYLAIIDRLKERLIPPGGGETSLGGLDNPKRIAAAYTLYEAELSRLNALDFGSLIGQAYRLVDMFPAIAQRYQRTYPYWLLDEFQDTNSAQYRLIKTLAGNTFKNIFAVADDDQIIYAWNGASYRQIQLFSADFSAQLLQLPTNYRCPAGIVEAANRLVAYNAQRTSSKKPLIAGKTSTRYPADEQIQLRVFKTEQAEADGVATMIAERGSALWGTTAVLARTRALLELMHKAMQTRGVQSAIAQRRDDFLSAEFRWLAATLRQISRPMDRRNLATLIDAFNRLANTEIDLDQVIAEAEASGRSYLLTWLEVVAKATSTPAHNELLVHIAPAAENSSLVKTAIDALVSAFDVLTKGPDASSDLAEDLAAWRELQRDILGHIGKSAPLEEFLHELQLRSKEPSPRPNSVSLMTIHAAKGREFDIVHVTGLAEDIMPSFQSRQKGDRSPEMEEERRNCFVAITRAKECLIISRAESYRGWTKAPSRFLVEMGLVAPDEAD